MEVGSDGDEAEVDDADESDGDEEGVDEEEAAYLAAAEEAAQVAAAVASSQAEAQASLGISAQLLEQISSWEQQQSAVECEWRTRQSQMNSEFEERKRRLAEQQSGQRKKFRESCDEALRPVYAAGAGVVDELEKLLVGRICRLHEYIPSGSSSSALRALLQGQLPALQGQQSGPVARIKAITFSKFDTPLRAANCPPVFGAAVSASGGVTVTLEKLSDRNGIAMLPPGEDPLPGFSRGLRGGSVEARVPLRLLGTRVQLLTEEEAATALSAASQRTFVVRYAGGENGAPVEPVQIEPEGLSLADYDISFAAGVSAMRVEHKTDGPVVCRAEAAAQKQVFDSSPVELYTQDIDDETHNIVQVYFSDLRDEVAVDVLNLTGTDMSLQDSQCVAFPDDATGAALNYKIIVRDTAVMAVLYQEGDEVHSSPFIEHRLPVKGAFVTLPDGSLGQLQALPRGLVVSREPRDLPENLSQWPPVPGLRPKGKHPAELPGMVDVKVVQRNEAVLWPAELCAVPVCAIKKADSTRLQVWHTLWDSFCDGKSASAVELALKIETLLAEHGKGSACAKEAVSELTELYGRLEDHQAELAELGHPGVDQERLATLQRGIQRFAALARFG